ncbi:MAG: hypothetical protein PHH96_07390 [Smithellaceae bacterium]|nr:hypothetical protein [Smithellaceae bacterium]
MDQNKLKKLLEIASPEDQIKLKVLHNAVINCIREYKDYSTSSKLKDWKSAEGALDAFIDTLWAEHFDEDATLPNLLAVVDYLTAHGWKIKKSAAYQHHKDGKLRPQKNGAYRISDVEKYASTFLKRLDGITRDDLGTIQQEKAKAELDKLRAQTKHWVLRNEIASGRYVEKDAFEWELAKRAIVFRNDLENFCRIEAAGIIALAEGNADKLPDIIEYMLDRTNVFLSRYAEDKEFTAPAMPLAGTIDEAAGEEEEDD